jgi:hypothetical protein
MRQEAQVHHRRGGGLDREATIERMISMTLGVVIERREIDNPWQQYNWRPVAVIPGAPAVEGRKVLRQGDGWVHYHAATLPLELHRRETEAYKVNLAGERPSVYVVMREDEDSDADGYFPFCITASPYEAQDYLDSGEEIVEGVLMDDGLIAWVQGFIDKHHVDEPFYKRKRKPYDPNESGFSRRPEARPGGSRREGGDG